MDEKQLLEGTRLNNKISTLKEHLHYFEYTSEKGWIPDFGVRMHYHPISDQWIVFYENLLPDAAAFFHEYINNVKAQIEILQKEFDNL